MAFSHKSKEHPEVEGTHKDHGDQLFPLHRTPPRIPPCVPLLTRSKEQVLPLSHHHLPSAPQSLPHPLAQPQVVTLQSSGPSPWTAAPQALREPPVLGWRALSCHNRGNQVVPPSLLPFSRSFSHSPLPHKSRFPEGMILLGWPVLWEEKRGACASPLLSRARECLKNPLFSHSHD